MTKEEWVEQEIAKQSDLPAHNKATLRTMKRREFDEWEREAVRIDSNNAHDDI